jgi:hypothetical protein
MRESMTVYGRRRWEKTLLWVIRGSRLFKISFSGNRVVKKVARALFHGVKRLPSRLRSFVLPTV